MKPVCSGNQGVAHIIGLIITSLSVLLIVVGCIILIAVDPNTPGIIVTAVGAVLALIVNVYMCVAFRMKWKLYGLVEVRYPQKQLAKILTMIPAKEDLHSDMPSSKPNGHLDGKNEDLEWNPDSVLPD